MLRDILEEHVDDATFLWWRRRRADADFALPFHEGVALRARLAAHVDGLLLDPRQSLEFVAQPLADGDPGAAYLAMRLALASGDRATIDAANASMRAALAAAAPTGVGSAAIVRAGDGQWLADAYVEGVADAAIAAVATDANDAAATPAETDAVEPALQAGGADAVAALRRIAARRLVLHRRAVVDALARTPDERDAALVALWALDPAAAIDAARRLVPATIAIDLLGVAGVSADAELLATLSRDADPAVRRAALLALGNFGRVTVVPTLLAALTDAAFGGIATAAAARIVGAAASAHARAPDVDDDADVDADAELPRAEPDHVRRLADAAFAAAPRGARLRHGAPIEGYGPHGDHEICGWAFADVFVAPPPAGPPRR